MSISVEKWLVMAALGVISAIVGFAPHFIVKSLKSGHNVLDKRSYHRVLTILSCAGGGVLFATALVHMLPENREALEDYVTKHMEAHFPLAEVLTLAGLCLIYLIEEVAGFMMRGAAHGHGHSHGGSGKNNAPFRRGDILRHSSIAHGLPGAEALRRGSFLSVAHGHGKHEGCVEVTVSAPASDAGSKTELTPVEKFEENKEHSELGSQLRSFLALIALSFHAIMEGIAVGIQNSSNLWLMFGAVASHKFVISFCMGMELCASQARLRTFLGSILLFAILSPLGIFIGSYLTSADATKSLGVSILEGFATGTILYVVFFEILSRERERRASGALGSATFIGFIQFLSMLVGAIGMVCLITLTGHNHGHEETEEGHEDHDHDHAKAHVHGDAHAHAHGHVH